MKMLPVHQVERTQLVSAGWWRKVLAGASLAPQWWQHWEVQGGTGFPWHLGQHSWAVEPWLLQCPCPGVHSALAETDPSCCGEAKGIPHPVWGLPTLQCLLRNNQLELLSGAWMFLIFWARTTTHFLYYHQRGRVYSSSHKLLLHLKIN